MKEKAHLESVIMQRGRGFVYRRAGVHYLVRALAVLSKGSQRVYGMDW